MNILISTGIYPPKIGGPAEYSKNLKQAFEFKGNIVRVATFGVESYLPTGLRHLWFIFKIIPKVFWADLIIVMDTFSVALPTVFISSFLGKKTIIRTGGDFLWESYVERTSKKVLLRNFYKEEVKNFSIKEKIIFYLTKWGLNNSSKIVFSTEWQRSIFLEAYRFDLKNTEIIENYYGEKEKSSGSIDFTFVGSARRLVWKNLDILEEVFEEVKSENNSLKLFIDNISYNDFLDLIRKSYAVILVSLGDISPNFILDSIRLGKPFICTKEIGIYERIKDVGIFVDPMNKEEIKKAILDLIKPEVYKNYVDKIADFGFVHSWSQIADEFLNIYKKI